MIKICPRCNIEFVDERPGYDRKFCSRSCANSRSHSKSVKAKMSKSNRNTWETKSEEGKQLVLDALARGRAKSKERWETVLYDSPFEDLGHLSKKRRAFEEQGNKCNKCGIQDWCGQPLTFEMEHIDGDKTNDLRET